MAKLQSQSKKSEFVVKICKFLKICFILPKPKIVNVFKSLSTGDLALEELSTQGISTGGLALGVLSTQGLAQTSMRSLPSHKTPRPIFWLIQKKAVD